MREKAGRFLVLIPHCVSVFVVLVQAVLLILLPPGFIMDEESGPFALIHSRGNVSDLF